MTIEPQTALIAYAEFSGGATEGPDWRDTATASATNSQAEPTTASAAA